MKVKGSALRSTMSFLRENYPPPTVERILNSLPEEDRKILTPPILTSAWFPAGSLCRLAHAMEKETPGDPQDLYVRLGKQSCRGRVEHRLPDLLPDRLPLLHHQAGDPGLEQLLRRGKMVILSSTSNTVHVRLEGAALPDAAMCTRITGWMTARWSFPAARASPSTTPHASTAAARRANGRRTGRRAAGQPIAR